MRVCWLSLAYLLHAVIHRQQRLQPLPLQHVGELHVDGFHGTSVAHDPVLVGVRSIVITGSTEKKKGTVVALMNMCNMMIKHYLNKMTTYF